MAPNEKAIRKWINDNRPDLESQVEGLMQNNGLFGIMAMAFEAGRDFQRANPGAERRSLMEPVDSYNFNYK